MMIGPEQGKKASGKSGKKKNKAKKAKRLAAEVDFRGPTVPVGGRAAPDAAGADRPEPVSHVGLEAEAKPEPDGSVDRPTASDAMPDVGPQLLVWIDRVQARVDHLLTLVDPASDAAPTAEAALAAEAAPSVPAVSEPAAVATPAPVASAVPETEMPETEMPETEMPETEMPETASEPASSSLAEAWVQREQTAEVAAVDAEPFGPGDARLTAVLVARELLARGVSSADVRRRLREGYGVIDPDAVLAQIAA